MEPVAVDSSVWIDYFRKPGSSLLPDLLESGFVVVPKPVEIEVLSGVSQQHYQDVRWILSSAISITPDNATWSMIDSWLPPKRRSGQTFSVTDLLVAALGHQLRIPIWSLDSDFARMEKLGFCKLFRPE